jgi:hypothetical protein
MCCGAINLRESNVPRVDKGQRVMGMASVNAGCTMFGCANPAVVGGDGQDVCLEHFFSRCYEQLEKLEPMACSRSLDEPEMREISAVLEECSRRAIFICFRNEPLTNLERSRLLEILLSCRDVQFRLSNRTVSNSREQSLAESSRK